jgi:hypothetical protein
MLSTTCERLLYGFTFPIIYYISFQMKQSLLGALRENCPSAIPPALAESMDSLPVAICFACLRAVQANGKKRKAAHRRHLPFVDRVPPHALTNKLEVIDPPPQLCSLNYIEDLLIKRVRPLQVDLSICSTIPKLLSLYRRS